MQRLLDLLTGRSEEPGLDRAALELARIEYPSLDPEPFVGILDSYARELSARLAGRAGGSGYVEVANQYLFDELGFTGNAGNYYDPRNSCLNEVLTARTGIPITLAVVYLEIGRRLAQPLYGIGLPGHFLVEYRDANFAAFIDVFHGGKLLTTAECFDLAREAAGVPLRYDPRMLAPASQRQILTRMLHNLRGVYLQRRAYAKALQTLNLLVAADPHSAEEYQQRGLVHLQMQNPAAARGDLETYLRLAPDVADRAEIERRLRALRSYQARLN
jgi:regulator of sirC expression with transglutaminase-like and TPR domain